MKKMIVDSTILPEESKVKKNYAEEANEPSQTFYVTVPERDQQLFKITTNPP